VACRAVREGALAAAGGVQRAVDHRGQAEQRLVEDRQHGTDLVDRADGLDPQRRGEPEQLDLLAQPPPDLRVAGRAVLFQFLDEAGDPPQRGGHRPAARLGGVGGQHQVHPEPAERLVEPVPVRSGAELRHGGGQRLAPRALAGGLPEQGAHPLPLLGQVDQVEVDGERLGDQLGAVQRPPRHQRGDLVRAGAIGGPGPGPGGDDRAPQPLHVVEQILPAAVADHLTEQVTEQPDIAPHGCRQLLPVGLPAHRRPA